MPASTAPLSLDAMRALVGQPIGTSAWFLVDQARIDAFADTTQDHQFIHVDPARAQAESPFGGTIAHGLLTLSMLSAMAGDAWPRIEGERVGINYGFDAVRFLAPVRAGRRIRGHFVLKDLRPKEPGRWLRVVEVTVEIEDEARPALVAQWLAMSVLDT